ncbi:Crp/Fnr family transcriptional regulator [Deinococcus maricopensis]|uniref:Transcriptional regulator, Crp/Fnr family n=1 Tax=Deinococcus maricopensis (strain DSM 21211 / LMG 22137 / NRRL B-23946 / LB-34) TaxID=709986 RepID=E8U997_DEIML|nr:Crp/Fnr family transcriptional regulator [Deinococcus maricopensis]ADV67636.1 transcriptional regulator, Crp/Fnr family [Deinococcus maricopensis DSM 21211]
MLPEFLTALPEDGRAAVLSACRHGAWSRGSLLYHSEDAADTLFLLSKGYVRLYRLGSGAREVTVNVHGPGDLLGTGAVAPGRAYGLDAEAMEDTEALLLGGELLRDLVRAHPTLGVALSAQLTRQTRSLQERLTHLVFLEVSQRLALALLDLAVQSGGDLTAGPVALSNRISHQDLAHLVGSTRETITKLLGEFKARGILDLGYRRIVIMDEAALRAAAREPLSA